MNFPNDKPLPDKPRDFPMRSGYPLGFLARKRDVLH